MNEEQQKNWSNPASKARVGSEATDGAMRGFESQVAIDGTESLVKTERMLEEVLSKENLERALKQVMRNKGAAGVDGMTVDKLPDYLKANWRKIRQQLLENKYEPQAVRRVEIPKPGGGMRQLGIPSVVDRFIQQAVQQVFQKHWDRTFSQYSYGFRPGKSAHQAVKQAQEYVSSGQRYVVEVDLEKFFDRVNHDVMMGRIAKRVKDKRVLKLMRAYLSAGMMEDGITKPTEEGVPQGGPLSPILSNLLLDELDRELEKRGLRFVRYADDTNVYVASKRAGERVMVSITKFLEKKLKLKVNKEKSKVDRPWKRKILGFTFTNHKKPKRRIAPQALKGVKDKIRKMTSRNRGSRLEQIGWELASYLRGWISYYSYCETPTVLQDLEEWMRHKLRCLIWKRWRRGRTRYKRLRKLGLTWRQARELARDHARGPWRMSQHPLLNKALTIANFQILGLPNLIRAMRT